MSRACRLGRRILFSRRGIVPGFFFSLLSCLFALPLSLRAAPVVPDAGQIYREQSGQRFGVPERMPPAAEHTVLTDEATVTQAGGLRFTLRAISIIGNTVFAESFLQSLLADHIGQETDLAGAQRLARRLTDYYRQNGYFLARAYLPAQTLSDGQLSIRILEGVVDGKVLNNGSALDSGLLTGLLDRQIADRQPLEGDALDRAAMLINEQPGVERARISLVPGQNVGATELEIDVAPAPRQAFRFFADNYGNRYSGELRGGLQASANNLMGRADQLHATIIGTEQNTWIGRLAWDGLLASQGLRAGVAVYSSRYELGKEFKNLGAHGRVNAINLYATYPLLRRQGQLVNLNTGLEHRWLRDTTDATGLTTDKEIDVLTIGAEGRHLDAWGVNAWRLDASLGSLAMRSETMRAVDLASARSQGTYAKLSFSGLRDQRLVERWNLRGTVSGQVADKNLDSSEKFSLGGPYGVRAYPVGEAIGDQVWLTRLELRHAPTPAWQIGAGYDVGNVRVNANPYSSAGNSLWRRGFALFAEGSAFRQLDLSAAIAWRLDEQHPVSAPDRLPRFWLQTGWRF